MVTFLVICGAAAALSAATGVAIKKKFWVKPKVIQSAVWDSVKQYSKDAIKAVKIFLQRTGKKFRQFVEVHFTNDSGALLHTTTTLIEEIDERDVPDEFRERAAMMQDQECLDITDEYQNVLTLQLSQSKVTRIEPSNEYQENLTLHQSQSKLSRNWIPWEEIDELDVPAEIRDAVRKLQENGSE